MITFYYLGSALHFHRQLNKIKENKASNSINSRHERLEATIFDRASFWDTALKFFSPVPRNDVTDHLVLLHQEGRLRLLQ